MWALILEFIAHLGLDLLGQFFKTATTSAQQAGISSDDLTHVTNIIQGVESSPLFANDAAGALEAIKSQVFDYFAKNAPAAGADLINAVLHLALHHVHQTQGKQPTPPAAGAAA